MARVYARKARPRPNIDRVTLIVLVAFIVVACTTAVLAVIWLRGGTLQNAGATPASPLGSAGKNAEAPEPNVPAPSGPLQRGTGPTPAPWDGESRITILFLGLDFRDWTESDIPRTDSMILFSIDPKTKSVGMLSIPRDLWVTVPGVGESKINTAYRFGEMNQVPGGGPGLAMATVEGFLGVPVNYYAMVDFNTFVRLIDEMGGLDMHIREEIIVDPIGPGNTVTLEPGVQTLDGATVLAYARQRYTDNDDFDRSERQQEVIMAIRQQVLQFNMLPTLIKKAPRMYAQVSSGISTNLTFDQLVKLALIAAQIDEQNIRRDVIKPPMEVEITFASDGQSILMPNIDQIRILRDRVFATTAQSTQPVVQVVNTVASIPTEPVDPLELMKTEKARVVVKNGTSTAGLASKTGEMLRGLGINVVDEGNADQPTGHTIIYDYSGKPGTTQFLIQQLEIPATSVVNRYDPNAEMDIEIVLGDDWAARQ